MRAVAVSPDGRFIVSRSWDHTVKVWEAESGQLLRSLEGHTGGVRAVLKYPRIRNKYAITDEDVKGLVALLEQEALVVPREVEIENVIPEDLADERVLACAVEAGADGIVSGDRHLLSLGAYRGISIVTAREFLERLRSNESEG